MTVTAQTIAASWEQFLNDYSKSQVESVAVNYPEEKSVFIEWRDIDVRDPALAKYVLDHPVAALEAAEQAVRSIEVHVEPRPKLNVRVRGLPMVNRFLVRKLRSEHLGRFVALDGMIKKVVEVRPKLQDALFRCELCGNMFRLPQDDQLLREPDVCPEEQAGCGRKGVFRLMTEDSGWIDHQKVELQESHDDLRGGAQPERITMYLEDDLVGKVAPGDRVVINGILRAQQRRQGSMKFAEFLKVVDVVSIEVQQHEFEEIVITEEDEAQIRSIAAGPNIYDRLRASFAPEIYGLDQVKDSLLLTLFGGTAKEFEDGTRLRGDIHLLVVGDPGTGKSQLLRYISKLAPRAVYTSGKGSSASGLTASAVRDEFGEGQWALEAGALVLADRGVALVDELDKMDPHDQSAMHQAMEQQEISIAKAGITATLKSRCAVIGGANPKMGRFDDHSNILAQINLPPALFSRFDLIFSLRDKPNKATDTTLATHVLRTHRAGQVMEYRQQDPDGPYSAEFAASLIKHIRPEIPARVLRKYIAYAKRNVRPVLTEDADASIRDYYVKLRGSSDTIPFTARALEAIVRLTEASARARLSNVATLEDASHAITLFTHALRGVGWNEETGSLDVDMIVVGASSSQQGRMRAIIAIIRGGTNLAPETYPDTKYVVDEAAKQSIPEAKVMESLETLRAKGDVYCPKFGRWATMS